jgi:transposase InsO family protein
VESFFATLKRELVSQERWATRGQAEKAVRDYLAWYNQQRRHSTLGYLSPAAFEARVSGRLA